MHLAACSCDKCQNGLEIAPIVQAGIQIITSIVSGALQRAANKRRKQAAWEQALQRIPEDDYVDYAQYAIDAGFEQPWKDCSWRPAVGGTLADFGLIHIREFGPKEGVPIKALPPGPRPDPGPPNNCGGMAWPVQVLHKLKPLANPVPSVPGVNDMTDAQLLRQTRQAQNQAAKAARQAQAAANKIALINTNAGLQISPTTLLLLAGGAAAIFFLMKRNG